MSNDYLAALRARYIILVSYVGCFILICIIFSTIIDSPKGSIAVFLLLYFVIQYFGLTLVMSYRCINCKKGFFSIFGWPFLSSHCRHCGICQLSEK